MSNCNHVVDLHKRSCVLCGKLETSIRHDAERVRYGYQLYANDSTLFVPKESEMSTNGPPPISLPAPLPVIKNCLTCAHRNGADCVLTGFLWEVQRRHPSEACDVKLSGWAERPLELLSKSADPDELERTKQARLVLYEKLLIVVLAAIVLSYLYLKPGTDRATSSIQIEYQDSAVRREDQPTGLTNVHRRDRPRREEWSGLNSRVVGWQASYGADRLPAGPIHAPYRSEKALIAIPAGVPYCVYGEALRCAKTSNWKGRTWFFYEVCGARREPERIAGWDGVKTPHSPTAGLAEASEVSDAGRQEDQPSCGLAAISYQ